MSIRKFSENEIKAFSSTMKIGLIATVNDQGLPHLTLISSLMACSPEQIVWGQFTEGLSKSFIRQNPKTGFLIMSMDKHLWRGNAEFTHTAQSGQKNLIFTTTSPCSATMPTSGSIRSIIWTCSPIVARKYYL